MPEPQFQLLLVTATPFQLSTSGLATMLGLAVEDGKERPFDPLHLHGQAVSRLISACRTYHEEHRTMDGCLQDRSVARALAEARQLKDAGLEVLQRHLLSPFPRKVMGVADPPSLSGLVPGEPRAGADWREPFNVARLVPELIGSGKGDMFQRRLCSSTEAFWAGSAGEAFKMAADKAKSQKGSRNGPHRLFDDLNTALPAEADHPKIEATCRWVKQRYRDKRHVLIFCVFHETQKTLAAALREMLGEGAVEMPLTAGGTSAEKWKTRFRNPPDKTHPPLVLVVRDNLSESIDLDGGRPCIVHHDLPWNPARLHQRYGRIMRISSSFEPLEAQDVFVPLLPVETDRRLFETLKGREHLVDLLIPDGEREDGEESAGDGWLLPDEVLRELRPDREED